MNPLRFPPLLALAGAVAAGAAESAPAQPPAKTVALAPGSFIELPAHTETELWSPEPKVIQAPPNGAPSDAIVLFDGKSLDAWEPVKTPGAPNPWKLEDGAMVVAPKTGYIRTKQSFGDIQLHLEFRTPSVVKGTSQGRGNSGVFFMGLYEVQVLDSFNNKTYVNGQVGAVYKQHVPLVNASRGPGEWQTYDIVFLAPTFLANGVVDRPARVTVFHNGVIVQHDVEIKGETAHRGYPFYHPHAAKLPLQLQDHGDLVAYRNIWVRELSIPGR